MWKERPITPSCLACLKAAEALRNSWFKQWPEMRKYFALISDAVNYNNGEIEQLYSKRVRGACTFTSGANTLFQGLAADGAKMALWDVSRACYNDKKSPLYGSRPVLFIHDEIGAEMPEATASEALEEMSRIMVDAMEAVTPDIKIRTDGALCRNWWKGAKDLKVNGRSVPVKPGPEGKGWVHDEG
jgi:DNA polymerase I-like protein with 3'-5' exonuclease and polymerase domains